MLPKVRGRTGSYRNQFFHPEILGKILADKTKPRPWKAVFNRLDSELPHTYGHPFHWNDIIHPPGSFGIHTGTSYQTCH